MIEQIRHESGYIRMASLSSETFQQLELWFRKEQRPFPWRVDRSPYKIWVSEIMLQQTQAQTVVPYFERFIARFPDIKTLALADEQEVLKYWEGLGYYTRARNLQRSAVLLLREYEGKFPRTYNEILKLPGIGRYTAGAIASLAFNLAYPAVDANVFRVMARFLNKAWQSGRSQDLRAVEEQIKAYYESKDYKQSRQSAAQISEALIELGAAVCTSKQPKCENCPWLKTCAAQAAGMVKDRPLAKKKLFQSVSEYTVLLIQNKLDNRFLVEQRPSNGLLASLWQFPMLDGARSEHELINYLEDYGLPCLSIEALPVRQHVFSHLRWQLNAFYVQVELETHPAESELVFLEEAKLASFSDNTPIWMSSEAIDALPFSAALFSYRSFITGR